MIGALATRLAGSSDVFAKAGERTSRSVNFIAAHDGMALADIVAYEHKHNEANGEQNRDGHNENLSWNNGVEGEAGDEAIAKARFDDQCALLATLFASRGTIMLTAGDEFGRTQKGNNNAYAQDNEITWLDWAGRDQTLEHYASGLAAMRRAAPALSDTRFLTGEPRPGSEVPDVAWLTETGRQSMREAGRTLSGIAWPWCSAALATGAAVLRSSSMAIVGPVCSRYRSARDFSGARPWKHRLALSTSRSRCLGERSFS